MTVLAPRAAPVVAMGGPMAVYETTAHAWIDPEVALIAGAISAGVPFLGVCLGAQLLARALGGEVFPGHRPEVVIGQVSLTDTAAGDAVLGGLPKTFPVLQWHSDTFTLPDGAILLAGSDDYPHQAFRSGSAYGLQFHAEAGWELASQWLGISEYRQSIVGALGPDGPSRLARDYRGVEWEMTATADQIVEAWLAAYVDPRLSKPSGS